MTRNKDVQFKIVIYDKNKRILIHIGCVKELHYLKKYRRL